MNKPTLNEPAETFQDLLGSYFYRPQRSCSKLMFLHLCVILFMGGGWSWPLSRRKSLSGRSLPRGVSVWRDHCPAGVSVQWGSLSRGVSGGSSVQGSLCLGGSLSRGGLCWGFLSQRPPNHMVTCGQYAF